MNRAVLVVTAGIVVAGCSKEPPNPPAQIVDLSKSVDELRRDFDAHKGEARFVAILSPT